MAVYNTDCNDTKLNIWCPRFRRMAKHDLNAIQRTRNAVRVCLRTRVSSKTFQLSIINLNYNTISFISGKQVEKESFRKKNNKDGNKHYSGNTRLSTKYRKDC